MVAVTKDLPVTHEAFVCPDVDDTNPHAAHVRCASHNKSHPGSISRPAEPLGTMLTRKKRKDNAVRRSI